MNRTDLQSLSRQRRREAAALLRARHFPGAYYLVGYAVECALKACIARQTRRFDFPSKQIVQKVFVHDLELLVKAAGLKADLDRDLRANEALEVILAIAKHWPEKSTHRPTRPTSDLRHVYRSCPRREH